MPHRHASLVAATAATVALAAAVSAAPALLRAQAPQPAPMSAQLPPVGGFSLTPHVGYSVYSDFAGIDFRDDGSDPSFSFNGSMTMKLQGQPTFGVTGAYQSATSPWGVFGDFTRSSGDANAKVHACLIDPTLGSLCDDAPIDGSGSQWRLAAGVTHRSPLGSGSLMLSLGALYGSTHFEVDDQDVGQTFEVDLSSPGIHLGGALEFPLSSRVGIQLRLHDAVMRVSDEKLRDRFVENAAEGGITVDSDARSKTMNAFGFGAGLTLRF